MMEWFVEQWDYLFHEERPPADYADSNGWRCMATVNHPLFLERGGVWDSEKHEEIYGWSQRHCLTSCAEGGYFPDVVIRRYWDDVEISWGDVPPAGCPDGFRFSSSEGAVRMEPSLLAEPLRDVLAQSVAALKGVMPKSKRILSLEKKMAQLGAEDRTTRRVAIMAGLGSRVKDWTRRWTKFQDQLALAAREAATAASDLFGGKAMPGLFVSGNCRGALMFGAVSPKLIEKDVLKLARLLVDHATKQKGTDKLAALATNAPVEFSSNAPWQQGYELARAWIEKSGFEVAKSVDIEAHLAEWGVVVQETDLDDEEIGGVAISSEGHKPLIVLNKTNQRNQFPSGRHFSLAHELCHLLHDRRRGVELALVSGPWAPPDVEKRANAFAAMFLMPDAIVEKAFKVVEARITRPTPDELLEVAKQLGVSVDALANHMHNRGWISTGARDFLLASRIFA
jgi:Zn-dependent peptidase ImmA (M78 family)